MGDPRLHRFHSVDLCPRHLRSSVGWITLGVKTGSFKGLDGTGAISILSENLGRADLDRFRFAFLLAEPPYLTPIFGNGAVFGEMILR